jgi:uncharacterized protein YjgD (DUF1641 family)
MKKEDFLKQLRSNEVFKELLSRASNDAERRAIKAYTEDFMVNFVSNVLDPVTKVLEKDPEAMKKTYLEIEKDLLNSNSGSVDTQE